jgi:hypothetical protein
LKEARHKESVRKATGGAAYIWRTGAAAQQKVIFAPLSPTVASGFSRKAEGLGDLFPSLPYFFFFIFHFLFLITICCFYFLSLLFLQ